MNTRYTDNMKIITKDDQNFAVWMNKVEAYVVKTIGLNLCDLPDEAYHMSFEEKSTPITMGKSIVQDYYSCMESFQTRV